MSRIRQKEKGQALVEFAIMLPILLIIMAVVFQISLMIDGKQKAQMATWYAIRAHSEGTSEDDIEDTIKEDFFGGSDDVEIEFDDSSPAWIDVVSVLNELMGAKIIKATITYKAPLIIGDSTMIPMDEIFSGIVEDDATPVSSFNQMIENTHR